MLKTILHEMLTSANFSFGIFVVGVLNLILGLVNLWRGRKRRDRQEKNTDEVIAVHSLMDFYDKEEIYPNCTVQVLTNTITGECSVGWWENKENPADD